MMTVFLMTFVLPVENAVSHVCVIGFRFLFFVFSSADSSCDLRHRAQLGLPGLL